MINIRKIAPIQSLFSLRIFLTSFKCNLNFVTILVLLSVFIMGACSEDGWSDSKENFTQTYMEILIAREQVADSTKAQTKVYEIMKLHGFNEQSFAQQFMEYSHTPDVLKTILDSAQTRARREIIKAEPVLKPEVLNSKKDTILNNKRSNKVKK